MKKIFILTILWTCFGYMQCFYPANSYANGESVLVTNNNQEIVVNDRIEPPKPLEEAITGEPPSADYAWVPGYWERLPGEWFWVKGHWGRQPREASDWIPGHWRWYSGKWHWLRGHWAIYEKTTDDMDLGLAY